MSSKGFFKDFVFRARSLKKDDPPQSNVSSNDQDGVKLSSLTPLMDPSNSESQDAVMNDPQKSNITSDENSSLITHSDHMNNSNERLVLETPSGSSRSGFENVSPTKSHDTGCSKADSIPSQNVETTAQSPDDIGDPPLYSQIGWAKLASFDRFEEMTLGSSPSIDASQIDEFNPKSSPDEDHVTCDIDTMPEDPTKTDIALEKDRLALPGLQKDGASSFHSNGSNSDLTPSQKFMSVAIAVQSAVRLSRLERAKRRAKWASKKLLVFMLSQIGLTLLVLLYATAGGFLFRWLEMDAEIDRRTRMDALRAYYLLRMWNETISLNVLHPVNWSRNVGVILKEFERTVQGAISDGMWDGAAESDEVIAKWTIPGSLLFSTTVITSIGYGDITPKTTAGKLVCIPFAIVGIPLTLVCLANIGQLLAGSCRFAWRRITLCARFLQAPGDRHKDRDDSSREKTRVPILVSLMIMLSYILLGAVLFSHWEANWSFVDGFYFCFVTLSTIGFGDFVPGQYETGSNERRVVCTVYLLLGLALLATVFQLMIDSVMEVVEQYAVVFGLSKEQIEEEIHDSTTIQTQLVPGGMSDQTTDHHHHHQQHDLNITIFGEEKANGDAGTDIDFHNEKDDNGDKSHSDDDNINMEGGGGSGGSDGNDSFEKDKDGNGDNNCENVMTKGEGDSCSKTEPQEPVEIEELTEDKCLV